MLENHTPNSLVSQMRTQRYYEVRSNADTCNPHHPKAFHVNMSMLSRMKKSSHRRSGDGDSLLRGVIDASFDPMLAVTSSDRKICMANDAAIKDFGYKYSELIGKDVSLIFASKDDTNRYMRASVDAVQEVVCCRKDATKFPAALGVREINECGQKYHSLYLRDLTEQKRQEQDNITQRALVQGMIDASFDPSFAIDEKGVILLANQAAVCMFGWSKEELIGSNIKILCEKRHAKRHDEYMARYLRTGEKRIIGRKRQVTARRKDGSEFEIQLGINEIDCCGKKIFCGFIHDLTKRLEDQKVMLNQELFMHDAFFAKPKKDEEHTPPTPLLTPPSTPLTPPHSELTLPSSPRTTTTPLLPNPPRAPRGTPRQRSVSLGKHSLAAKMNDLKI